MSKDIKLKEIKPRSPVLMNLTEKEDFLPHIRFTFEDLPVAKDWENGREYKLVLIVKQDSSDEDSANFIVKKVGGGSVNKGRKFLRKNSDHNSGHNSSHKE